MPVDQPAPTPDTQPTSHESHQRRSVFRALVVRRTVIAVLGSGGWILVAYLAILGRRYHVAGPLLLGVMVLYAWAFWHFAVRRF